MEVERPHPLEGDHQLSPVISRPITAGDLSGLGGRVLPVAAGQVAILTQGAGQPDQVLKAGRHRVRGWLSLRLPAINLISTGAYAFSAHLAGLLAGGGDGELLDADIQYQAVVTEPARLSGQLGTKRREWRAADVALVLEPRVRTVLAPLLRQYALPDLLGGGLAVERLMPQFRQALAAALAEFGLALEWVQPPALYRSEDAALQAQQAVELRQKLREIELDDQLDELQKQAELEDFQRQLQQDAALVPLADAGQPADMDAALAERAASLTARATDQGRQPAVVSRPAAGQSAAPAAQLPSGDELRLADTRLRQGVAAELNRLREILRNARSRVYDPAYPDPALRLKRLEAEAERLAKNKVPTVRPAYLAPNALSPDNLRRALSNDDAVLAAAQALTDLAQSALDAVIAGQPAEAGWDEVEAHLASLEHRHAARARLPGATMKE